MSVKDTDFGWQKILKATVELSKKPHVRVGIQGESALESKEGGDSVNVVDVATFHEFGTVNIPERSFLRSTYDANEVKYIEILRKFKDRILNPNDKLNVKRALGLLGQKMKADIQKTIRDGLTPVWAESTRNARLKKAGGAIIAETPLIDTGQLLRSIDYKVEDGN